ncbi:MAG: hypothetical protein ACYTGX_02460 [Planctomycetota bacterium]|jgi:hypothetical protein
MRPLVLAACAWLLAFASGCIVWNSHLEPGVADFPASLEDARKAPIRLLVRVIEPKAGGAEGGLRVSPERSERLAALITQADIVSEAATDLALGEGRLDVLLHEQPLGSPALALVTALTVGVVPYFGGRRVEASAELFDTEGRKVAEWQGAAEVRMVGHLFFLAGWNLDALHRLQDDALRGIVVRLAAEQHRLTEVARPPHGNVRTVTSR